MDLNNSVPENVLKESAPAGSCAWSVTVSGPLCWKVTAASSAVLILRSLCLGAAGACAVSRVSRGPGSRNATARLQHWDSWDVQGAGPAWSVSADEAVVIHSLQDRGMLGALLGSFVFLHG